MGEAGAQFTGFGSDALTFLAELAANNDRAWFQAHKDAYERSVKAPMLDLVADLSTALARRDVPLHGDPKRALFRIHRDTRFARDKSPYKTNVGAVLTRTGDKHDQGLLYVHLGLDRSFVAVGFYMLEPNELKAFRERIVQRPKEWRAVGADLAKAGLALGREGATTRLPRGFDAAKVGDLADDLKLKSFIVSQTLSPDEVASPAMVDRAADLAVKGQNLLQFGWQALDGLPPDDRHRRSRTQ